jgi:hypothetical protein
LTLAIVAAATKGYAFPGQKEPNAPIRALLQIPEDMLRDVVKPRLTKCGADCSLIDIAPFEWHCGDSDVKMLEKAIEGTGVKLLIVDPLDLYLHDTNEKEYFTCVRRFSRLAASTNCAVVLVSDELPIPAQEIMHSLIIVGPEEGEDKYLRGLSHMTSILGGNMDDYAEDILFRIHPEEGFQWIGLKSSVCK